MGYLLKATLARFKPQPADPLVIMKIMASLLPAEQLVVSADSPIAGSAGIKHGVSLPPPSDSGSPWNISTITGLLLLVLLWAVKLYTTWGAWGNLSIDSGHEMYVPLMLAEGKELYRDVWFMYGPAAPYFSSYLFRIFGVHLNVLYWAGAISALGCATFLYLTGMRISSPLIGFTAAAVVLMEGFQPSIFSFPMPYASAAVYACFVGCLFLWLAVNACFSKSWVWVFGAGTAAAFALLLKPEFGMACYGTLALLIVIRGLNWRSWNVFAKDVGSTLPGVVFCALVIRWMVSIAGAAFITQENIVSWPTSYFMKAYGKMWMEKTGFTVSGPAFLGALDRLFPVAAVMLVSYFLLRWKGSDTRRLLLKTLIVLALATYFIKNNYFILSLKQSVALFLSTIFFPQDMVLYVIVAAVFAWGIFLWKPAAARNSAIPLILTFSSLLAFRILMKMLSAGYAIFYNGPVVLSFLLVICLIVPRSGRPRWFVLLGESILCLACFIPVVLHSRIIEAGARNYVSLSTPRGIIRTSKNLADNYTAAIRFMQEKASLGQSVLSIPEDTSLYFLSGTICPTRIFSFTPGILAPGRMTDEMIQEIDRKPVQYLLWSNRTFPEFGVPVFGEDFDREVGDYLKSHYRPVGPLLPNSGDPKNWAAIIWERIPEGKSN
jgi:hypothetical protein